MRAKETWDIPIIIIEGPNSVSRLTGLDRRHFWLIEGHQRMRCLAVFGRVATCATEHDVFVPSYPEIPCFN